MSERATHPGAVSGRSGRIYERLARHPKLRVQLMHAGYPMIDNMFTLLRANSRVYVDLAGLIWGYPIKEVPWPRLMAYSISIIQNADYLTAQQKRAILYNNAARFLRFDTGQGK